MENARISHYELRRLLGRGGMGEVYEAFDLKAKRLVALKFIAPELASDPAVFKRFETEAVSAAAMNHPHIATLYEFEPEGARPFIAMELVAGPSLRARISQGPLDINEALEASADVAAALAYAHRRNIVHRDIKPENLMYDEDRRIKVMDFGLARAMMASRLTMTGSSLGTPAYMAPESVQHGSGGPPADVFALGLVLMEMLTGSQVFRAESPLSVMFAIAKNEAPPLRSLRGDAPEDVEALITRILNKDPEQRPDALSVAKQLAKMTGLRVSSLGLPADSPLPGAGGPANDSATTVVMTPLDATTQVVPPQGLTPTLVSKPAGSSAPTLVDAPAEPAPRPSRSPRLPAIVAVVVLIAGAMAALWWRNRSAGPTIEQQQQAVVLNNQAFDAMKQGDLSLARAKVAEAIALNPDYGEALLNRAQIFQSAGSLDSAAMLYRDLLRTHGKDAKLAAMTYFNLGDLALNSNANDQAVENLTKSLANDSASWQVYNNLGYALTRAGRPGDALAPLSRGITRFPGAAALYKNSGLALLKLGHEDEALAMADRALGLDANYASARGLRARLRARAGDLAGALADWRLYIAANPPPAPDEHAEVASELLERGVDVESGAPDPRAGRRRPRS